MNGPSEGWYLGSTENFRYFVPGSNPDQVEGNEEFIGERLDSTANETQGVLVASSVRMADSARNPRKGAVYESERKEWTLASSRQAAIGRFVHFYGTFDIPRFNDVEYPNKDVDRYKTQQRKSDTCELTYRYDRLRDRGDGEQTHDVGYRKDKQARKGQWGDTGPVPGSALDKIRRQGYNAPVKESVDTVSREDFLRKVPKIAAEGGTMAPSAVTGQAGAAFSTGTARGTESARRGADAGKGRTLVGAGKVAPKGLSQSSKSSAIDMSELRGIPVGSVRIGG